MVHAQIAQQTLHQTPPELSVCHQIQPNQLSQLTKETIVAIPNIFQQVEFAHHVQPANKLMPQELAVIHPLPLLSSIPTLDNSTLTHLATFSKLIILKSLSSTCQIVVKMKSILLKMDFVMLVKKVPVQISKRWIVLNQ